ncbi:MAG: redoxin domain-containing protein [Halobacteriovoraceae bacterium]|nr:redoxin domain-containing protein [Halobacteriovoraceae bacterium]
MGNLVSLFLLPALLFSCGKNIEKIVQKPINKNLQVKVIEPNPNNDNDDSDGGGDDGTVVDFLKIDDDFFINTDGETQHFSLQTLDRPLVVLFSSPFCGSCKEEHTEFQKALEDGELVQDDFDLFSYMISVSITNPKHLFYFKDLMSSSKMTWPLGGDPQRALFQTYCPEPVTPCALVFLPEKGLVYAENGLTPISKFKSMIEGKDL